MENTKTTAAVVTTIFQNERTTVITPQVITYVKRYQMFARKTAESIVGLATTLLEAEQELNGVDFALFCDEVGIKKGDTTYSKIRKIGTAAARFKPYLDKLPSAYTTLYELAKLEASKFEEIASDLNPFSTAKEISEALGLKKEIQKEKQVIDLTIAFGTMGSAAKKEVYDAIIELKKNFKFSVIEKQSFIEEMKSIKKIGKSLH